MQLSKKFNPILWISFCLVFEAHFSIQTVFGSLHLSWWGFEFNTNGAGMVAVDEE